MMNSCDSGNPCRTGFDLSSGVGKFRARAKGKPLRVLPLVRTALRVQGRPVRGRTALEIYGVVEVLVALVDVAVFVADVLVAVELVDVVGTVDDVVGTITVVVLAFRMACVLEAIN